MAYYGSYKSPYQTPFNAFPEDDELLYEEAAAQAQAQQGGGLANTAGQLGGQYMARSMWPSAASSTAATGGSTAAAAAIPEGMTAVGTAMDGSTMLAPTTAISGEAVAASPLSLSGIGSAGNAYLPAAGVLGMADVLANKRGWKRGALQGAASGAAIGSYVGMPWLGAGIGGAIGLGKGLLQGKPKTNVEQDRWKALGALGYAVPDGYDDPSRKHYVPKGQLINPNLAADFVGNDPTSGAWVNNKFSRTRDEKDLVGKDLVGYATFGEKFGKDWMNNYSLDQKEKIAQKALDLGAVREHHGTVDVTWNPEIEAYAKEVGQPPKKEEQKRRR